MGNKIKVNMGEDKVEVDAILFGKHLAVTKAPNRNGLGEIQFFRGEWNVIHVHTGLKIGPILPKREAIALAERLSGFPYWNKVTRRKSKIRASALEYYLKCARELDIWTASP